MPYTFDKDKKQPEKIPVTEDKPKIEVPKTPEPPKVPEGNVIISGAIQI
ncbi:MAG: hypothetical protein UT24_C0029G0040 [Candidatus Woesebacteria bacterium GW2011_GWB1_39_12]|uniref:Uncharacterized protein n=1 Tax=Candidatus Woesebacteria bacterium GW2011_GWB1_39_12 TaxID=1618574 RepID=A0A0G0M4A9_9BACT|nr:MAG: hypothetical protein UT24_C0029G0040 [Candidatus Woesebacteria bacterium GW2011_GWB1_39_12]